MRKLNNLSLAACLVLMILAGCYSELSNLKFPEKIEWSPELALPLVNSSFTIADLLNEADSTIEYKESDGVLVITIEDDSLFSSSARDFYSLSDKNFPTLPLTLTQEEINEFNLNGQVTVNRQAELPYESDLDSVQIERGLINLELEENFPANGNLSLSISAANVNLLDYQYNWNYDGVNAVTTDFDSNEFDEVTFTIASNSPTMLVVDYNLTLTKANNTDLTAFENTVDINLSFVDADFKALYGDLNTQDISTERNTIKTDFLNDIDDLNDIEYYFERPRFSVTYINSMGLPVLFDVVDFTYYKEGDANEININSSVELAKGSLESPSESSLKLDEQFKSVINDRPDSVSLAVDGIIDPNDTPDNFVTSESNIQVGYKLELPLELTLSGLNIEESFGVEDIDPGNTRYAILNFKTANDLPFDVSLKAVALSEDSTELKTLFEDEILTAGSLENPSVKESFLTIEDDPQTESNELDFLEETSRIAIIVSVATANNGNEIVQISSQAEIQFSLSVQFQYTLDIDTSDE